MARRKKKRVSRRRGFNVLGGLEAIALLNTASQGFLGGNVTDVVGGAFNIGYKGSGTSMVLSNPGGVISVRDLVNDPGASFDSISQNFKANWLDVAVKSTLITTGFKFGKKIFAPTRRKANQLIKMAGLKGVVHF